MTKARLDGWECALERTFRCGRRTCRDSRLSFAAWSRSGGLAANLLRGAGTNSEENVVLRHRKPCRIRSRVREVFRVCGVLPVVYRGFSPYDLVMYVAGKVLRCFPFEYGVVV